MELEQVPHTLYNKKKISKNPCANLSHLFILLSNRSKYKVK